MRRRLLDQLERNLTSGLRHDAKRAGVSEATARILLSLAADDALPMGRIASRIGRDPSTATRFVDRATEQGLVVRVPGLDRRRRLLKLTPEGEALKDRLLRLRRARAERVGPAVQAETGLGEDQVEWFLDALVRALLSGQ